MTVKIRYDKKILNAVVVLLLMLGVSAIGVWRLQFSHAASCEVTDKLVNPCRPWLGANTQGYPGVSGFANSIANHEALIGRQLDVVHDYRKPGEVMTADDVKLATRANTYLMLNWKPSDNWGSAGGSNTTVNTQIDNMAKSIKNIGQKKIFLAVYHEPENNVSKNGSPTCGSSVTYVGGSGTTAQYVAMWHNVRSRFDALGVSNVVWTMNYMGYDMWNCMLKDLWPGNTYVDWVVWDKYMHGEGSMEQVYRPFYNELTSISDPTHDFLSKPWGLNEWGDAHGTQAQVAQEYASFKQALDNNTFPRLKLYDIFDNKTGTADFRIGYTAASVSDPSEPKAYSAFANDPIFTLATPPPVVDTIAPTTAITNPVDQTTVTQTIQIQGSATDDSGVKSVALLVDGNVSPVAISAPFDAVTINWDSTSVANGTHTLQLQATDTVGNVGLSVPVTVTVSNPDTKPPTVPDGVVATPTGVNSMQLSWNKATDDTAVTGYGVYRDGALIASVTDGSLTYTDTNLVAGQLYQYSVTAYDAVGNTSAPSAPVVAMVADTAAPTAPSGLSYSVVNNVVALSWLPATDNVGVTSYDVLRDSTVVATVSGTTTAYSDSTVTQGASYTYTVRAHDAAGNVSPDSSPLIVAVPDVSAPSIPQAVSATASSTAISLSWQPSSDNIAVAGYKILRDGLIIGSATGTSYIDSTAQVGKSYTYTVQAFDAAGNLSYPSAPKTGSIPDVTAPSVVAQPTTKLSSAKIGVIISWQASTDNVGVASYSVWRNGVYLAKVNGTTLSYADTTVSQAATYSYGVTALDAAGNASPMSPTSVSIRVPDTAAPTTPTGLIGTSPVAKTVKLTWKASSDNVGVSGYNIYRGTTKIASTSSGVLTYTVTGLTSGVTYKFTVQARDAAWNLSPMSSAVTVKAR